MSQTYDELTKARREKLERFREIGANGYPNDFKPNSTIKLLRDCYDDAQAPIEERVPEPYDQEALDKVNASAAEGGGGWSGEPFKIAGRIKLHRCMGKSTFAQIADHSGIIQIYLRRSDEEEDGNVPREQYNAFKKYDLGDIVGVEGWLYRTNKGEFSIRVISARLLTKSLCPLPDKHHGLTDQEARYRQRYLDLMVNPDSMEIFKRRIEITSAIRRFMEGKDFLEVETPIMHPIPGGATARPFTTHHNALDMELYMRVAPELYLKRLIVGGFTKIFELNRSFRNEGLSPRHNPEFTMMEFYWAYADYQDLMGFIEEMFRHITNGKWGSIARVTMQEAVIKYALKGDTSAAETYETLCSWWETNYPRYTPEFDNVHEKRPTTKGGIIARLFEEFAEEHLQEPTFITEFPIEISPLARRNDQNPDVADRFEMFINGQEIANGFSELNDPDDQAARFKAQVAAREGGNDEAMFFDADYIQALEYGMPPTAGAGIGIDRLVMLLLEQSNIRDVILFPLMRPR